MDQFKGMVTLAIETSTPHGSVALYNGERLLFEESFVSQRGHSALLFPLLQQALKTVPRPDRIAVGLGPGSYAGVRIGIATAMGLQMALGCELVGVPSVASLHGVPGRYIAVGDARRETFYWTEVDGGRCLEGPLLITAAECERRLSLGALPVFTTDPPPACPGAQRTIPTATRLAELASHDRGIWSRDNLEPLYLREAHITQPKKL